VGPGPPGRKPETPAGTNPAQSKGGRARKAGTRRARQFRAKVPAEKGHNKAREPRGRPRSRRALEKNRFSSLPKNKARKGGQNAAEPWGTIQKEGPKPIFGKMDGKEKGRARAPTKARTKKGLTEKSEGTQTFHAAGRVPIQPKIGWRGWQAKGLGKAARGAFKVGKVNRERRGKIRPGPRPAGGKRPGALPHPLNGLTGKTGPGKNRSRGPEEGSKKPALAPARPEGGPGRPPINPKRPEGPRPGPSPRPFSAGRRPGVGKGRKARDQSSKEGGRRPKAQGAPMENGPKGAREGPLSQGINKTPGGPAPVGPPNKNLHSTRGTWPGKS